MANKKVKNVTLDDKHHQFMCMFDKDQKILRPHLKRTLKGLNEKLLTELSIDERMDVMEKIENIEVELKNIKNRKKQYLLENSGDIFEYFKNKKNIERMEISNDNTQINNFFKIDIEKSEKIDKNIDKNISYKYLSRVDEKLLDINHFISRADLCTNCKEGELIPNDEEGMIMCNKCFCLFPYFVENDKHSYKDPPREVSFYAYKKINHFKEIIAQFQGKQTTTINPEIIEKVKLQIKKERLSITNECLTHTKMKSILKKINHNKLYEHINYIKNLLGIQPPIMDQELEETLYNLFSEMQAPYCVHCPQDRVNFLNYYYTLYKLCELIGETQYLEFIPQLKDPNKITEQDIICEKIFNDLGWEFKPTTKINHTVLNPNEKFVNVFSLMMN